MIQRNAILTIAILALAACTAAVPDAAVQQGEANRHMHARPHADLIRHFESTERDAWQQPGRVLELLGDLEGKTVMDLGSGSGYFSFRLAAAGAHVICADVDETFLGHIRKRRDAEGIAAERMELRHIPYDSAGLRPAEADLVLTVNTYHHIEDRVRYFAGLREGLKAGGRLVVIDFFQRPLPVGPPASMKQTHEQVAAELRAAGFSAIDTDVASLEYQYVVKASP